MEISVQSALAVGLTALGAGYLALIWSTVKSPSRAPRFYCGLVLPGAFLSSLTGVFALHQQPSLLNETSIRLILACVVALALVDYGCFRVVRRPFDRPARTRALIPAASAFILGVSVILGIARVGSG